MNSRSVRRWLSVPRPTGWHLFALLVLFALGSEYWDKDPANLGSLQLPWPRFLVALLALPLIVPPRHWRWSALLRIPSATAPLLLFWVCSGLSILSVLVAPGDSSIGQFLKTFVHLTMYVVFVCVLVRWMTWPRLSLFVRLYYALGIVAAALAVVQWVNGTFGFLPALAVLRLQSAEYDVGEGVTTGFRAASFFGEPSWAARYYVHFLAIALGSWWHTRARWHLGAIGLFLFAFYTANSLLGYVILIVFVATVGIAQMVRRNMFSLSPGKKLVIGAMIYAAVIAWLVGVTPRYPDLVDRSIRRVGLVLQGGGGAGNRIDSVFAGIEVWKLAPVAGVGLGNIDGYIVPFYQDPAWTLRSRYASDSLYVQVAAETGVVGLLAFLWFWANLVWFRRAPGLMPTSPDVAQGYLWLRFLQVDLLAQAVGMLNSSDYLNPHLWTVVAIVISLKVLLARDSRQRITVGAPGVTTLQPTYA